MRSVSARSRRFGQGMTEYIIVIAIVAIGAILIIGLFGKQIKGAFSRMGSAISGQPEAAPSVGDLQAEAKVTDAMNTFDKDAGGAK